MKTQQLTTQDRFTLALNATWSVLRDPVLTKIYMRQWKRYLSRGKSPSTKLAAGRMVFYTEQIYKEQGKEILTKSTKHKKEALLRAPLYTLLYIRICYYPIANSL